MEQIAAPDPTPGTSFDCPTDEGGGGSGGGGSCTVNVGCACNSLNVCPDKCGTLHCVINL